MIGQWFRLSPRHKWHYTESVIDGDAITRCGRRLTPTEASATSATVPLTRAIGQPQLCRYCDK